MVADVDALSLPTAAGLCVWALHHQLIQHGLDNLGHGAYVMV
jgi:hypothetical protein